MKRSDSTLGSMFRWMRILTPTTLLALGFGLAVSFVALSSPCSANGLDADAATSQAIIASEEPQKGREMTARQEKYLGLRNLLLQRSLEEAQASWKPYEKILGRDRCRELDRALFRYNLVSPAFGHDLWQDQYVMDDMADTVLSAYAKIQRENLEDILGVDEWLDRRRPRGNRLSTREAPSYRVRVSPRLSSDHVGVKFRMPYSEVGALDHMSFRVRYNFDEARPIYMLKFDDHARFFHFSYEPDTRDRGDLFSLSMRLVW